MRRLLILMLGLGIAGPALAQGRGMALVDFQAAGRTRLMQADANGDGMLTAEERRAARGRADD